jgi:S-adenosylmethionine-diacylglycerol 3-amino-3-carboxypropyl transferase
MNCEISTKASFTQIRYAQCWEDADVLLRALVIQPGDTCLAIASAGDNALAMLCQHPARVIALDLSFAQLACLELRMAAYRCLGHHELLELVGSSPSQRRWSLYLRCRELLGNNARRFWDGRSSLILAGIGAAGKFERYLRLFRCYLLPLIHPRHRVAQLLHSRSAEQRHLFFEQQWNNGRWRALIRLFCCRWLLGRFGRDPSFFAYAEGDVDAHVLARSRHALTALDPAANPYLQWILYGRHLTALPYALRPEHFETIRANLDRLELRCESLEQFLAHSPQQTIDRFNLSNVFEYMPPEAYQQLLVRLVHAARPGGRLAYWNMLAPRSRPDALTAQLRALDDPADQLYREDKVFFYSRLVIEEVQR